MTKSGSRNEVGCGECISPSFQSATSRPQEHCMSNWWYLARLDFGIAFCGNLKILQIDAAAGCCAWLPDPSRRRESLPLFSRKLQDLLFKSCSGNHGSFPILPFSQEGRSSLVTPSAAHAPKLQAVQSDAEKPIRSPAPVLKLVGDRGVQPGSGCRSPLRFLHMSRGNAAEDGHRNTFG